MVKRIKYWPTGEVQVKATLKDGILVQSLFLGMDGSLLESTEIKEIPQYTPNGLAMDKKNGKVKLYWLIIFILIDGMRMALNTRRTF